MIAFEIFDELIESPAPLLGDSIIAIVQFSLEVSSSANLDLNTRHQVSILRCIVPHNHYFKQTRVVLSSLFNLLFTGHTDNLMAC